jgi:hypothetical protein
MKKLLLSLLFATICSFAFAQTPLRPAEIVASSLEKGETFETVDLFQLNLQKSRSVLELDKATTQYDVLTVSATQAQELLRTKPQTLSLTIPSETRQSLTLELVQVDVVTDDFILRTDVSDGPIEAELGVHYRGIVSGDERSIAAISVLSDGEVMGLVSADQFGNLTMGRLQGDRFESADHIIYNDKELLLELGSEFSCGTEDDGEGYTREELADQPVGRALTDCVDFFYEVDYDIFQNKGANTTSFITGLHNQVATLYSNENINTEISEINIITSSGNQYSNQSSSGMLNQFQSRYGNNSWNGDLAQLLSYKSSGGIAAGFAGICNSNTDNSMSFSNIQSSYLNVPSYSWSVMVVTHEFGHIFGSRHTHACVWNGNNTAIDGCAGQTEGSCSLPGFPSNGGTIMSYCHLQSVGINFNNGFGPQPGNVIRNNVANGSCLSPCGGGGGPTCSDGIQNGDETGVDCGGSSCPACPTSCNDTELTLTILTDNYPGETTWTITSGSSTVASGGPYGASGTTYVESICLPDGCDYTFTIFDSYGDGICCAYGSGSYSLTGPGGTIASGGSFTSSEATAFEIGNCGGGGSCTEITFTSASIESYGGSQDNGTGSVFGSGEGIILSGNAWKSIDLNYTVTSNTVIEFEFGSTSQGEIHGIGFDNNSGISSNYTFQLYGTQNWGNRNYDYTNPGYWQSFTIPVGSFYTGTFDRLFFSNDKDSGTANNNSYFRNIKIHEGGGCGTSLVSNNGVVGLGVVTLTDMLVYPNPTSNELNVNFNLEETETATLRIFNLMGQVVEQRQVSGQGVMTEQFDTAGLPEGTYMIRMNTGTQKLVKKFTVAR